MNERYAFIIQFLPEKADKGLLAGRCIEVLHNHTFQHNGCSIGVGFPGWSKESLGSCISFSSVSNSRLQALKEDPYFPFMKKEGLFKISEIIEVTKYCREVRFIRNQTISKCFIGEKRRRMLRAKRRAESRGETYTPQVRLENRDVDTFHVAYIDSNSTQKRFSLFIQKDMMVSEVHSNYNSYGLATNDRYRGTVPELSYLLETIF